MAHDEQCQCSIGRNQYNCIDLSYPLSKDTIYWPTDELGFQLCMSCSGSNVDNNFYAAGTFSCAEHGGTHVDAPYHFNSSGQTVDKLRIDQLIGPLKVIDIQSRIFLNENTVICADYSLTVQDIMEFESQYGILQDNDIVIIRTMWSQLYQNGSKEYLGFDPVIDGKYDSERITLHFPGISPEASQLLVHRRVKAVGLDTASLDPGPSKDFLSHRILLGAGIYGIENINSNIAYLPKTGASLIVMPLKIAGGSGGPSRVLAMIPETLNELSNETLG